MDDLIKCKSCQHYELCDDEDKDCAICGAFELKTYRSGPGRRMTPYERTKAQVYATGNKLAIENFNATH